MGEIPRRLSLGFVMIKTATKLYPSGPINAINIAGAMSSSVDHIAACVKVPS